MNRPDGLDVCFYEAFEEEADALRRFLPSNTRSEFTWKTIQEAADFAPPARLISIRTQSVIPPAWAGNLGGILARATGYDGLVRHRGTAGANVQLGYLPLYCARAVAEQAMLLWMALLRKLPLQMQQFTIFHRDGLTGSECENKNLLVVGVGHIGSEIVKIGQGLGMNVRGVDIVQRHSSVLYVSKEDGVPWADVMVCAMNLTADNIGYFTERVLQHAKRGAIFVNVARGEMSPPPDLLRMLDEGRLGGVALDVFDQENKLAVALRAGGLPDDVSVRAVLELAKRSNVICTPHNAFNTSESVERKAQQSAQQTEHFLRHGRFLWPVPG
ncbi:MAG: hydroxyacid dehydrogenase [Verrucomicrobia bacterium]|nr:hydroxyacid dehydrogenase [Verrucomicrobiota bacterium]